MKKIIVLLGLITFISCDDGSTNLSDEIELEKPETFAFESKKPITSSLKAQRLKVVEEKPTTEKKLIKTGSVGFKTDSLNKTKNFIANLVNIHKGYISSENTSKYGDRINQYMSVRIPANQFDIFLEQLSKGVNEFDSKEINVSDVTARYYDLQSRIKNKKQLEKRYLQILSKARSVKDILDVERELGKLREDIESAEGRLKYLSNQVSFSTLNIRFYEEIKSTSGKTNRFVKAFKDGIQAIKSFALFLVSIWPFVILISIVYLVIRRRMKKRRTT